MPACPGFKPDVIPNNLGKDCDIRSRLGVTGEVNRLNDRLHVTSTSFLCHLSSFLFTTFGPESID